MARRVTTKDKWKAKAWYTILAPKEFGEVEIGETPASEAKEVVGRTVEVAANELAKGKGLNHVKLILEIENVAGTNAKTRIAGYEVVRSYIRSIVRRRRKRIDLVKDFTFDKRKLRVKLIAMAIGKCYMKQEKDMRHAMEEVLDASVKGKTVEEFIASALNREIQDAIKEKTKKVFPIGNIEIRKIQFL